MNFIFFFLSCFATCIEYCYITLVFGIHCLLSIFVFIQNKEVRDVHDTELLSLSATVFSLDKILDVSEHFKSILNSSICSELRTVTFLVSVLFDVEFGTQVFLLYCFVFAVWAKRASYDLPLKKENISSIEYVVCCCCIPEPSPQKNLLCCFHCKHSVFTVFLLEPVEV